MQIGLVTVAFVLSFISAVAAQTVAASGATAEAATSVPYYQPQMKVQPGLVGAIIGGTLGGTLIVVTAVLFIVRRRMRCHHKIRHNVAGDAELAIHVAQLQSEVRAMREQLDRLEAYRVSALPGYGAVTPMYTHEKDLTTFKQGVEAKDEKVHPPTYAD
ncbi:hypothetical protein C8R45DRAFT_1112267 [Mycena sanguinolenta]|nr:hypothetical protein C8R45DRAFT_1112267 [Mycena sanguinolenta]